MSEPRLLPSLLSGVRTLTDGESALVDSENPRFPTTPDDCITCKGEGSFRFYALDSREVDTIGEYKCDCADQWVLSRYLLHCGIKLGYQRLGWPDTHATEQGALSFVFDWLDHADDYVAAGCGMMLHGAKYGSGKTLLANLALKRLVCQGHDGYFTTFADLLRSLMDGFDDPEAMRRYRARIRSAGVLVVDDVGREHRRQRVVGEELVSTSMALAESTIDDVIRHRNASSLPTIITTNLDPTTLARGYGGASVVSLLAERCAAYEVVGTDYRPEAHDRLIDEVRRGLRRPVVVG